jgi:hypothetical protein
MDEQIPATAADHGHAGGKGQLWPRHAEADDRAVDDPQIFHNPFEAIKGRVAGSAPFILASLAERLPGVNGRDVVAVAPS